MQQQYCPCCKDHYHPEDMRPLSESAKHIAAEFIRVYHGPLCHYCSDRFETCEHCGNLTHEDDVESVNDMAFCHMHADEAREEMEMDAANLAAERKAWRNQR